MFMLTAKTNQTAQAQRLICVFVRRTCQKVRFLTLRHIFSVYSCSFWSRAKKIGSVLIPLKDFDFTFETWLWCKILNDVNKHEETEDAMIKVIRVEK